MEKIRKKLIFLYGKEKGNNVFKELKNILSKFKKTNKKSEFSEKDSILITYGDLIRNKEKPLKTLNNFSKKYLKGNINTIHILPFFPYYSDRGFSILDYKAVDPNLGNWQDIKSLHNNFKLMFDYVLNHMSNKGDWFKQYINNNPNYKDFFISYEKPPKNNQLSKIFRPRPTPILAKIESKYYWRTFLNDQLDLNYGNEKVLLEMIKVLLLYVSKGANLVRMDAVAFLWKKLGTSCIHLKQTHTVVQLFRDILDIAAPNVLIVTETNVPHKDNISYFGNGFNEAQMVYNFTLPPLVVQAIQSRNTKHLTNWAKTLKSPSKNTTFFNFLDSHDGIGLLPTQGILNKKELDELVKNTLKRKGKVGFKKTKNGKIPYEMNITWWSILNNKIDSDELNIKRYLLSRSIALSLKGMPGIYLHGLLGTENDLKELKKTKHNRDINRKNLNFKILNKQLKNKTTKTSKIFYPYLNYLKVRSKQKAFHPTGKQIILNLSNSLFALKRKYKKEEIICIHNVTNKNITTKLKNKYYDLIKKKIYNNNLKPYQFVWLKKSKI